MHAYCMLIGTGDSVSRPIHPFRLAEDDVLWHHIALQSQHKMPVRLKPPGARWKPWFSKMTQHKREVGRRWKEMGAVFHQVRSTTAVRHNT